MSNAEDMLSKIKEISGEAHIIHDPDKLEGFAVDGKIPKVVVSPGTIDEVSKVVAYANAERLVIIPRGNGTKMGIGGIPKRADILLCTGRLNRITDRDCENLTLSVESGVTLHEVQRDLEGRGYFLPLDPPFTDKATLGGIVAANSSGPRRLLYGTARDLITGIKAVFPNGDIVVSGGKTVKNVSGYDMVKLLIGSLGTLGIICEITFNLLPLPEKKSTLLIPFPGLDDAYGFVDDIIGSQLLPASLNLLSAAALNKIKHPMPSHEGTHLAAIGLEGIAEAVDRQASDMGERGRKHGGIAVVDVGSEQHEDFWNAIRDFAPELAKEFPNLVSLKSNILISKGKKLLRGYENIADKAGVECAFVNQCGNGIIYSHLLVEEDLDSKADLLVELIGQFTSHASQYEGNLVVESSPPSIKERVNVWGISRSDYGIMQRIKEQLDPGGILNPGRFIGGM
jgi:glycolate oxidase FAD binding subunit